MAGSMNEVTKVFPLVLDQCNLQTIDCIQKLKSTTQAVNVEKSVISPSDYTTPSPTHSREKEPRWERQRQCTRWREDGPRQHPSTDRKSPRAILVLSRVAHGAAAQQRRG
ncbi:hypothetical protein DPEC_G00066490 [Dallia pectoralis]|uniref:Uncharacterized protein n=1 Tax=Dallia pectoralis TaxID=75939 RepID=A0ACC2H8J7_DALPE|nr:hypothetical protein DPEC_G00066490 [Dallia pectoralis]